MLRENNKIKVKIERQENADFYNTVIGNTVDVDFQFYVSAVVASEIGNANIEACKAQAIAARTFAYPYYKNGKEVSDLSSKAQAFRAARVNPRVYPNAIEAAKETDKLILYYNGKPISTCSYSHSNGGRTVSAEERWGSPRPWLIAQNDPWDYAVTHGKKNGHGVGMSQVGAGYAASELSKTYEEILAFYYPGCEIKEMPEKEGGDEMSGKVKATYLITGFKQMLDEKWKYEWGAAREGVVDCSGSFVYWYKKAGSEMYHGSNTMYRKWSPTKGKIGTIPLVPGMAVYKWREWKCADSDNPYYGDALGNLHHVGLYIGNGQVIEAKGTKYGVVTSPVGGWQYCSTLKDTDYDVEGFEEYDNIKAFVSTEKGSLNVRTGPGRNYPRIGTIPKGAAITILKEDTGTDGWYYVLYEREPSNDNDDLVGYVDSSFVTIKDVQPEIKTWALKMVVGDKETALKWQQVLAEMGLDLIIIPDKEE